MSISVQLSTKGTAGKPLGSIAGASNEAFSIGIGADRTGVAAQEPVSTNTIRQIM